MFLNTVVLDGSGHAGFGPDDLTREIAYAFGELLIPGKAAPAGRHVGVGEFHLGGAALAEAHAHAVAHPFTRALRVEDGLRTRILALGVRADEVLEPPRHFVIVTATEHGRSSALVETAGETLLAAFLVDEGRLPALLAEIAHATAGAAGRRGGRRCFLPSVDADVLAEGASESVGERQHPCGPEAGGLAASDTRGR